MNQEMEFKNIVAQYSKVKPEEMTGEIRFRCMGAVRKQQRFAENLCGKLPYERWYALVCSYNFSSIHG